MPKLDKRAIRDAAELFAAGQMAAEAAALDTRKERTAHALDRVKRTREAMERLEALSAAEVLCGVDDIRQAALNAGCYRDAIAASKLLLDHLAPVRSEQSATVTGSKDADTEARRKAKLREISQYGIRVGTIEMQAEDN